MTRYVAFLRGINLGKRRLKMDRLAALFEELEFANVATFIASGNVVFDSDVRSEDIEASVEGHLLDRLGYEVDTFVRSMDELKEIAGSGVFTEDERGGRGLYVSFLRDAPGPSAVEMLKQIETPDDRFEVGGRELYWLRNGRLSDSPIATADLTRALNGVSTSMRNMNTIERIVAKFGA